MPGLTESPSKKRRRWWDLVRLGITLAAVGFVLNQITWKDRFRLESGEMASGWLDVTQEGVRYFQADDGSRHLIPPEPADPTQARFFPGFWTLLRGINAWLLLGTLLAFPLGILLMARRWQWLLRTHGLDPGYWESLRLTWIGILANNVLPGATGGDLVKGWCIYRRAPGKQVPAVMTVLIDRVLGLVSLMLVSGLALLVQSYRPELEAPSRVVRVVLLAVAIGGIVFFSGRIRRLLRVSEIVARLPFNKQIRQIDDSVFHYRHHIGTLVRCVGISLVIHFWVIGCSYYQGRALGLHVGLGNYFILLPVIFTVGAFVPSIAGLGVMEGLYAKLFSLPGVGATPSSAVALCILYRLMILAGSLPGTLPMYREFSALGVPILGVGEAPLPFEDAADDPTRVSQAAQNHGPADAEPLPTAGPPPRSAGWKRWPPPGFRPTIAEPVPRYRADRLR